MTPFSRYRPLPRLPQQRADGRGDRRRRLDIPPVLVTALGCDAVGVPAEHGPGLMNRLPRVGCVFTDGEHWWWIVPSGSDADVSWPPLARYAVGASVPVRGQDGPELPDAPRLIHLPEDATPYTPPIPLYLMVCQLAGIAPAW